MIKRIQSIIVVVGMTVSGYAQAQSVTTQNWAEWLSQQDQTTCMAKKLWTQFKANPDFELKHQDHAISKSSNFNGSKNVTETIQIQDMVDRTIHSLNQGYTMRIRALEGVGRGQQIDLQYQANRCLPSKVFVTCHSGNPKQPNQDFTFVKVKLNAEGQCAEKSKPISKQVYTCPIELRFCDFIESESKQ